MGSPLAGHRCSDEVALLCSEKQCNDIVKASGTSLGDPLPHTSAWPPSSAWAPWACRASPPPCSALFLLHGNLRSRLGLGLWGQRAPFPPGRGPALPGQHSCSRIPPLTDQQTPGSHWQACLILFPCCTTVGLRKQCNDERASAGLRPPPRVPRGGIVATSLHFPAVLGPGWELQGSQRSRPSRKSRQYREGKSSSTLVLAPKSEK